MKYRLKITYGRVALTFADQNTIHRYDNINVTN